jgi:hypothetical protein
VGWGLPHVVFTGKQTIDGDTAQVGPGIAKRLNYNQFDLGFDLGKCGLRGSPHGREESVRANSKELKRRTKSPLPAAHGPKWPPT